MQLNRAALAHNNTTSYHNAVYKALILVNTKQPKLRETLELYAEQVQLILANRLLKSLLKKYMKLDKTIKFTSSIQARPCKLCYSFAT
jgi:hypothetical protein